MLCDYKVGFGRGEAEVLCGDGFMGMVGLLLLVLVFRFRVFLCMVVLELVTCLVARVFVYQGRTVRIQHNYK